MRFFEWRRGTEAGAQVDVEIASEHPGDPDELKPPVFDGLHHLYFASEASALRASLDSVVARTDVRTARDVREVLAPTPAAPAPAGARHRAPKHA